jgi:hypothetical protein
VKLTDINIVEVWLALGGGPLRARRGKAFWRGGDSYSVSVDPPAVVSEYQDGA